MIDYSTLSKEDLISLADKLLTENPFYVDFCIRFVLADTKELWHGRARAKMCRRLKRIPLSRNQRKMLVATISTRLIIGDFSEQFRDQLRFAMRQDLEYVRKAADTALKSDKEYVIKFAKWVLDHQPFLKLLPVNYSK